MMGDVEMLQLGGEQQQQQQQQQQQPGELTPGREPLTPGRASEKKKKNAIAASKNNKLLLSNLGETTLKGLKGYTSKSANSDLIRTQAKIAFVSSFVDTYFDHKQREREVLMALLGGLGVTLAIIAQELAWDEKTAITIFGKKVQYVLMACSITTILLCCLLFEYYWFSAQIVLKKLKVVGTVRFWHLPSLRNGFLGELFICLIHPLPGLSYIKKGHHGTHVAYGILTLFMFLRAYLFIRAAIHYYPFWKHRRSLGTKKKEVAFSWYFIIKELFYSHPLSITCCLWVTFIFITSYCVYVAERETQPLVFGEFKNSIWHILITASTIGYGDTFPTSTWGRSVSAIAGWLGIVLAAIVTAVCINQLTLNTPEKEAVDMFHLGRAQKKLESTAVIILQTSFRRNQWRKKQSHSLTPSQRFAQEVAFSRKLGFLFFNLKEEKRRVGLMKTAVGEDSKENDIFLAVEQMKEDIAQLKQALLGASRAARAVETPF